MIFARSYEASVFVIGAHYDCSFSILGVAQDLYNFINERW